MFDFHDFVSSWSHLLMAGFMTFAGIILFRLTRRHPLKNAFAVDFYAASAVMLYLMSGLFHGVRHVGTDDRRFWQLMDQTAIFGLIYGSNVPILVYLLPARRRNWLLLLMGALAVVGAMCLWFNPNTRILAAAYVGIGLLGTLPIRTYFGYIGWYGIWWVFLMVVTYIAGALCEALNWPTLFTGVLTSHELLHLFVMAGTLSHLILLVKYVIPVANRPVQSRIPVDRTVATEHNSSVAFAAIPPAFDRR